MQQQVRPQKPTQARYDESRRMMALQFFGKKTVKVGEVPVPIVTDPTDVVVKVTAITVCGTDLHIYNNAIAKMEKGDIIGHESVGVVSEVGAAVKNLKIGDRVVISPVIACGQCEHCKKGEWSCCDTTNDDQDQEKMYGHNTSGMMGNSHATGGYDGCQAEYVRVPFGDVNLFPIPPNITDKQAVTVADIAPTAYHGTELAEVKPGDKVVVFGCGPVGLLTLMWAKYRGASRVIGIDVDAQRLNFAREKFGAETVNSKEVNPIQAVSNLIPGGPDSIIDCVGLRFPESFLEKVEFKIGLATDAVNIINTAIQMVRKNGKISLIGEYVGYANHVNIGGLMEKHLTMNGGPFWPHKYYKLMFEAISSGAVDPTIVFTHTYPLSKIDKVYEMFDKHEDNMIKTLVLPDTIYNQTYSEINK